MTPTPLGRHSTSSLISLLIIPDVKHAGIPGSPAVPIGVAIVFATGDIVIPIDSAGALGGAVGAM